MEENWKGKWFVDKKIQQAQYMNRVNEAWIPHEVKDFCRYVASKATWNHSKNPEKSYYPCYATFDTIEIQMNRSTGYISKAKRMALELGWIQVMHRSGTSDLIWPRIGEDDPSIRRKTRRETWGRQDFDPVD